VRYYRSHIFSILEYRVSTYPPGIRVGRDFSKSFLFSTTKEIIILKDDLYYFAENFKFGRYKSSNEGENGRGG